MTFASIASLLQAALSLLLLVQSNSSLPPSLISTAEQTAQQAITEATAALSGAAQTQTITPLGIAGNSLSSSQTVGFAASPTSGTAPLTVTFTSNQFGNINFGDGQSGGLAFNDAVYTTTHTYTSAGTYTATLAAPCSGTGCTAVLLGTVTITVSGSQVGSLSFTANPTSGNTPLTVSFEATGPQGTNIGQAVSFGDGTSAGSLTMIAVPCAYGTSCPVEGTVSHTYSTPGTFTANLLNHFPQNFMCTANNPNCNVLATVALNANGTSGTVTTATVAP